jgi:hypothetical protein
LIRARRDENSPMPRRRRAARARYGAPPFNPSSITELRMRGTSRLSPVKINRVISVASVCHRYGFRKARMRIKCFMGFVRIP